MFLASTLGSPFFVPAPNTTAAAVVFAADQQALQHAVRQRDLLGLSCLLSHGFGLSPALIEGLVESCGPRCVQDCFLEAVASARYGTLLTPSCSACRPSKFHRRLKESLPSATHHHLLSRQPVHGTKKNVTKAVC